MKDYIDFAKMGSALIPLKPTKAPSLSELPRRHALHLILAQVNKSDVPDTAMSNALKRAVTDALDAKPKRRRSPVHQHVTARDDIGWKWDPGGYWYKEYPDNTALASTYNPYREVRCG
jgi:hypothetical protein